MLINTWLYHFISDKINTLGHRSRIQTIGHPITFICIPRSHQIKVIVKIFIYLNYEKTHTHTHMYTHVHAHTHTYKKSDNNITFVSLVCKFSWMLLMVNIAIVVECLFSSYVVRSFHIMKKR